MAELADVQDLDSCDHLDREGSTPTLSIDNVNTSQVQ